MFLNNLWVVLVGVVVLLYVILDGFTLGVGILFPGAKNKAQRDILMNSIGPVWDANQTWIVFGGGALFATFPMIYTVLFSALYIPLFTFLFGLIFRGVAFEFRHNAGHQTAWERAFFIGCTVAAFAQGLTLGAYISGIKVQNGQFAGGPFDWLQPFNIMVGLALIAGYALLGATYLIIKTDGEVQARAYRQAKTAAWIVAGFMLLVSIWTPSQAPAIVARWFEVPRVYFVWIFPLLGIFAFIQLLLALKSRKELQPFFNSLLLFVSAYLGLQSGIYPLAVPPDVTIYQAAAQYETQLIMLIGTAVVLPVVLAYTVYSYSVFKGKVTHEAGYH
jgi:cytochrome d ubiquinol oxidase subunit II